MWEEDGLGRGLREPPEGGGNMLYLDWGLGYLCVYICQNSQSCTPKIYAFHCIHLNLSTLVTKRKQWRMLHQHDKWNLTNGEVINLAVLSHYI